MIVLLESIHPDGEQILRDAAEVVLAPDSATMPDVAVGAVTSDRHTGSRSSVGRVDRVAPGAAGHRPLRHRGLDNIDVSAAHDHGVTVVYAPGVTAAAVSEHAMMLALCLARQTVWIATATAAGAWAVRDGLLTAELRGRTMGVVGLGAIGTRVAMLGTAFGMQVVGWSRHHRDTGVEQVELDDLVASCDLIQLCVALAPETARLIDAASPVNASTRRARCEHRPRWPRRCRRGRCRARRGTARRIRNRRLGSRAATGRDAAARAPQSVGDPARRRLHRPDVPRSRCSGPPPQSRRSRAATLPDERFVRR